MSPVPVTSVSWEELASDPYPVLAQLRSEAPVAYATGLERFLVTSRPLVLEVLRDTDRFTTADRRSSIRRTFGPQMLSVDGEEQVRHRRPFSGSFRQRALATEIAPLVEQRTASLLDRFEAEGGLLNPAAAQLAVGTVVDVLGLLVDDLGQVRSWYDDLATALADKAIDGFVAAESVRSVREAVGRTLVAAPRGVLAALGVDAEWQLTADEIGANVLLILFGGIETTESMILNAVWCLGGPDLDASSLAGSAELLANAVEESLRWEPAVQTLTRFAVTDGSLGDVEITAGATVECMVGAANRDPSHFRDPDSFRPDRSNARDHLTFGYGRHLCLGLHLARLEAGTFLRELIGRRGGLRIDRDRSRAPYGHEFRRSPELVLR